VEDEIAIGSEYWCERLLVGIPHTSRHLDLPFRFTIERGHRLEGRAGDGEDEIVAVDLRSDRCRRQFVGASGEAPESDDQNDHQKDGEPRPESQCAAQAGT
jgi:hypothetical protein